MDIFRRRAIMTPLAPRTTKYLVSNQLLLCVSFFVYNICEGTFPYILGGSWTILIKHLNFGWLWWLFKLFYHKIYSKIKIGFSKGGRVTILQNIVTKFCSFLTMAFSPDNIHKCVFESLSHWAGFSVFSCQTGVGCIYRSSLNISFWWIQLRVCLNLLEN